MSDSKAPKNEAPDDNLFMPDRFLQVRFVHMTEPNVTQYGIMPIQDCRGWIGVAINDQVDSDDRGKAAFSSPLKETVNEAVLAVVEKLLEMEGFADRIVTRPVQEYLQERGISIEEDE